MKKNILITGGCGFIGSNLCHKLANLGHHITCLDNLHSGKLSNIRHLLHLPNFCFVEHNVILPYKTKNTHIDEIYHLACPASPPHYQGKNAIFTTKTCVLGALNFLELAKAHKARILLSSTSEVYGEPLQHPQQENYRGNVNPIGIRACYDEGKRCAESLFFDYHRNESIDIKIVRIFNTYGPRMSPDDGRVISNFICQALSNQNLTIYGEGNQTRSFQYIDDLLSGLIRMMASPRHCTGPINLGNPQEFTIEQLAQQILQKIPETRSQLSYKNLPSDDPSQRKPDISLAKKHLHWSPRIPLSQGLDSSIAYFRQQLLNTPYPKQNSPYDIPIILRHA